MAVIHYLTVWIGVVQDCGIVTQREFVLKSIAPYLGEKPQDWLKFCDVSCIVEYFVM
jgi:hypothetical protein